MTEVKLIYAYTKKCDDGNIYDYYCERFPCGEYIWSTTERKQVTDKKFIEWYNKYFGE